MNKIEWPGISIAVGIVLILTLIGAGYRDDFHLKDYASVIAAFVAVGGALLAYKGAMAKVDHDRDESRRELLREQLSLYLKLEMAARRLMPIAQHASACIGFATVGRLIKIEEIRIKEPVGFAEAWDALDVFPRSIIRQIAIVREKLTEVDDLLDEALTAQIPIPPSVNEPGTRARILYENIERVIDACVLIRDGLTAEINRLAPDATDDERHTARYGDGDIDFD